MKLLDFIPITKIPKDTVLSSDIFRFRRNYTCTS